MEELADVLYCPNLLKYAAQFIASHYSSLGGKKGLPVSVLHLLDFTFLVRCSDGRPYLDV